MVDEQNAINTEVPQEPQPVEAQASFVKMPPPESRFLFVDVAALRAKQLRRGARIRLPRPADGGPVPELPKKAERVAMEEVRQGLVSYELVETPVPPAEAPEGEEQQ